MDQYATRRYVLAGFAILVALIFLIKLFHLQTIDSAYKEYAEQNTRKQVIQYPARGLIYDRNNELMVYNQPVYDVMVSPYIVKDLDTAEFCRLLEIERSTFLKNMKKAKKRYYASSIFLRQISSMTYAKFQAKLHKFPGFFVQPRTLRKYASPSASHVLGYVGEVNDRTIEGNPYYKLGDYIGIRGLEKTYEKYLRGTKGVKNFQVDVFNRIQGPYLEGSMDVKSIVGENLMLTLDADLQAYGEQLMQNKRGSIVAIEPSSGEILAMISAPGYDPELLVGRARTNNYRQLLRDTLDPLFNRAIRAKYRPGSTFKLVNGLIGLQEGITRPSKLIESAGPYYSGGVTVGCHNHEGMLNLYGAVKHSCNKYFCRLFREVLDHSKFKGFKNAYGNWEDHVISFGFGKKLVGELENELSGFIPNEHHYNKIYGKRGWSSLTIISMAIGEGELGITPVQMANEASIIANRGHYIKPHLVKKIGKRNIQQESLKKHKTSIDSVHYETIIEGMSRVLNQEGGTAYWHRLKDIEVCGKTGTIQNPGGRKDHSAFIAFAPRENPQIAIAVYVEYGGYGSTYAAPISTLMIEKYLKDTISNKYQENRILNAVVLDEFESKN